MDPAVDELFTLAPSEFTAARNALVKQLRADKRREEADEVKALRRPSVPAWALNQVARAHPDAVERVISAGAGVVAAQRRALSGVRDAGLREASLKRREAIDDVWRLVASVLRGAGAEPQAHRLAVAGTLEAASLDADVAAVVHAGRLTSDVPAPSGFGDVAGFTLVAPPDDAPAGDGPAHGDQAGEAKARAAAAEAKRLATQARRRADELAERAAEARRSALRTADEATRLEQRAAKTRERAQEEAAVADDLAAQADRAAAEAEQAEAAAADG